jgi:hypothetical protein
MSTAERVASGAIALGTIVAVVTHSGPDAFIGAVIGAIAAWILGRKGTVSE